MAKRIFTVCKIRAGQKNRFGDKRKWIYGELIDGDGDCVISATLDYIIGASEERGYEVTNLDEAKKRLAEHNEWYKENIS